MGLIGRFRGRRPADPAVPEVGAEVGAPQEGDSGSFLGPDGVPALHLVPCRGGDGEVALHLCEDTTGRLVDHRDSRLPYDRTSLPLTCGRCLPSPRCFWSWRSRF